MVDQNHEGKKEVRKDRKISKEKDGQNNSEMKG
jgi:hypothetical protein